MIQHTTQSHIDLRKVLFWILVSLMAVLGGLYMYFISMSVVHIVLRQELSADLRATEARIGDLEARYLTALRSLGDAEAEKFALVPVERTGYVALEKAQALSLER